MLFLESWLLETTILLTAVLFLYYVYYLKFIAPFWAKRNIPHLEPKFMIGNVISLNLLTTLGETNLKLYKEYKHKRILGFWGLHYPLLAVFDREIIKNILTRDFAYFHDRVHMTVGDHDFLTSGNLFTLSGHAWRNMRVKLAPTFTSGKMKMMYPTMMKCGEELNEYLRDFADREAPFDFKEISSRFTTNMIGSCAFGIEINALKQPDCEFRKKGKCIFEPTWPQIFNNILITVFPFYGKFFKISQLPSGITEFFLNLVRDTMESRKLKNIQRKDFMQLLLELKEKGRIDDVDNDGSCEKNGNAHDTKFTYKEAAAQAFVFFAAGFETSSVAMSCACFELAKHKEIQMKLKEEIKNAVEECGGKLSFEAINKLELLNCVIQETLRKYPNVPVLFRQANKDYYIEEMDVVIPNKTLLFLPFIGLANDPEYFPNPGAFDPWRFSSERKSQIVPYTFIPFGEGPRICIANRFGMLQAKVGLVSILTNYTVEKCDDTPENLKFGVKGFALSLSEGVHLKLTKDV